MRSLGSVSKRTLVQCARTPRYGRVQRQAGRTLICCHCTKHLWMCLVCGHVGCGRFSGRHAYAHFEETGHTFAYELDSQRVWDYAGDQYVHRLIQSKTDGKLVEVSSTKAIRRLSSIQLTFRLISATFRRFVGPWSQAWSSWSCRRRNCED